MNQVCVVFICKPQYCGQGQDTKMPVSCYRMKCLWIQRLQISSYELVLSLVWSKHYSYSTARLFFEAKTSEYSVFGKMVEKSLYFCVFKFHIFIHKSKEAYFFLTLLKTLQCRRVDALGSSRWKVFDWWDKMVSIPYNIRQTCDHFQTT